LEENKSWANSLSIKSLGRDRFDIRQGVGTNPGDYFNYLAIIGLYDADGIRIAGTSRVSGNSQERYLSIAYSRNLQILPQNRYFNTSPLKDVKFTDVKISDITDDLSVKVDSIVSEHGNWRAPGNVPARIMSQQEWNEWLKNQ
jgi:hypothetical protein